MRGWPSWNTSSTAVIEMMAPNEMIAWPQPMPATSKARASGSAPFSCW